MSWRKYILFVNDSDKILIIFCPIYWNLYIIFFCNIEITFEFDKNFFCAIAKYIYLCFWILEYRYYPSLFLGLICLMTRGFDWTLSTSASHACHVNYKIHVNARSRCPINIRCEAVFPCAPAAVSLNK